MDIFYALIKILREKKREKKLGLDAIRDLFKKKEMEKK